MYSIKHGLCIFVFLISSISAATINVPADYSTIQGGIDAAVNGDTVLVQPGTYVENINFNGKNIVVGSLYITTGDTSYISQTIIDGGCPEGCGSVGMLVVAINQNESDSTVLQGFTIQNGRDSQGGGINVNSAVQLKNLIIKDNRSSGSGGGITVDGGDPRAVSLHIYDNTGANGGGIAIRGGNMTLVNCLIYANKTTGNEGGGGLHVSASSLEMINCTVSGNYLQVGDGGALFHRVSSTINLLNCILWGNAGQSEIKERESGGTVIITYSDIQGGYDGTGNIDLDPSFISDGSWGEPDSTGFQTVLSQNCDFHLSDYSPGIGAGLDTSIVPTTDIEGNPRPNPAGSNPDLGAYELEMAEPVQGPTLDAIADTTIIEDSSLVFFVSGNDQLAMPLTYSVFGHDSIGITVRTDTVTLEPKSDFFSPNPIPLYAQVCNTYICSPVDTFNIIILPVNDPPSATLDLSIVSDSEPSIITLTGSPGPPNESGQLLSYTLISLPDYGTLALSAVGAPIENAELPLTLPFDQVFFQPPAIRFLRTNFQYLVIDNGGTENGGADTSDHHLVSLDLEVSEIFSLSTSGPIEGGITLIDNSTIYAAASGDKVYRFDNSGSIEYTLNVNGDIKSSTTLTPDHTVYIASTDNNLYSFNASGVSNPNWPIALGAQATASVAMDADRNVYIGTQNGIFQAISPSGDIIWSYNVGAAVYASAAISIDNTLYITNHNGRLFAFDLNSLDPTNLQHLWRLEIAGNVTSSPALDNSGHVYLTTTDGRLVKILDDGAVGEIVWEYSSGSPIESSPVIDSEYTVYFGCDNGKVYAVDITGNLKWEQATSGPVKSTAALVEALTEASSRLYIGSSDGFLYAIALADGAIIWKYNAHSEINAPTMFNAGIIYTGTADGQIIAIADAVLEASLAKTTILQRIWPTFQGDNTRTGYQGSVGLSVANRRNQLPYDFALHQNYPNPFNPTSTIQYDLPEAANVTLVVYDILGREVIRLVDQQMQPGYHRAVWDARDYAGRAIPTGIYIARLVTPQYTKSIKMVLLK